MRKNIIVTKVGIFQEKEVFVFKVVNNNGAFIELTNFGATIVSINVPDNTDKINNIVLGYNDIESYYYDKFYLGSTIGRVANRIGKGKIILGENTFYLEKNENKNTLHGGFNGFNRKVFDYFIEDGMVNFVTFSEDGEGGFPGGLKLFVKYFWNDNNELKIEYSAVTTRATVANFTNHSYFNLSGCRNKIFDHELEINANELLEFDSEYIPTGKIISLDCDKRLKFRVKDVLNEKNDTTPGLNHYFIFNKEKVDTFDCKLIDPLSGRGLLVNTSYPGVLVYTADFLDIHKQGLHEILYGPYDGICLECHHFPDSPNHENFPSIILSPGQIYNEYIIFGFFVDRKKY